MTWTDYIFKHLIPAWFNSFKCNFYMWSDLMTGNYEGYAILPDDDPYTECYEWFWSCISMDETYPKDFLGYLQDMVNTIDQKTTGEEINNHQTIIKILNKRNILVKVLDELKPTTIDQTQQHP